MEGQRQGPGKAGSRSKGVTAEEAGKLEGKPGSSENLLLDVELGGLWLVTEVGSQVTPERSKRAAGEQARQGLASEVLASPANACVLLRV